MGRDFLSGARRALPIILSALPFALLFGALAVENGLSVADAMIFSAAVYAGASQMVGIELFGQRAEPWLIAFSIFVVNLRHLLYSASTGRHMARFSGVQKAVAFFFLIDPVYAETERETTTRGGYSFAWYMGLGLAIYATWIVETGIGAVFGRLIPDPGASGIDFLLTVYFLGLVMAFRSRAGWLPVVLVSAAASVAAYKTVGAPWHVSLGALAGVIYAAAFGAGAARRV